MTFNKFSVILMYVMVVGLALLSTLRSSYPPSEFVYCWFGFWAVQAIITAHLKTNKRKNGKQDRIVEEIAKYINDDNAQALAEKFLGVNITKK